MNRIILSLCLNLIAGLHLFADETSIKTLALGDSAPDFDLPGVDGRNYTLKDFSKAKLLMVVFTCNHCPTAQAYQERLTRLVTDYKDKGVAVAAISPNDEKSVRLDELGYTDLSDSFEEMKIRARHKEFNFPYLYDGEKEDVSRAYGPTATPHVFIFDSERKLRYVGRIDDSEREELVKAHNARNALEAMLAGRNVPANQNVTTRRNSGLAPTWYSQEKIQSCGYSPTLPR